MTTQFERMKSLFDELGVRCHVEAIADAQHSNYPGASRVIITDEGDGYNGFMAVYAFAEDGSFRGYGIWD